MADYTRKYHDAPSAAEIEQGYAPSTIRGTPFAKFLFWTIVGVAASFGIGYGTLLGFERLQGNEDLVRYKGLAARQPAELRGPRLQPSPGHEVVDWQEMDDAAADSAKQLVAKKLWAGNASMYKSGYAGKPQISDAAVGQTAAAMKKWVAAAGAKPAGDGAAPTAPGR